MRTQSSPAPPARTVSATARQLSIGRYNAARMVRRPARLRRRKLARAPQEADMYAVEVTPRDAA